MIATPSIASLSRPTYSVPDVNRLRRSFPGRPWQNYEAGRYKDALRFAIKINKKDAGPFADFMGVERCKHGLYQEALTFFDEALELDPKLAQAWNNKGMALGNLGRNEEAITCYDKALEIDPKDALVWNNKGAALCNLGRNEEAITCCEKALELDPKYAQAWNNKGLALYNLGRYEEAIEKYQEALKLNRDLPESHINLAVLLSVTNRHDEAAKEFKEALRLFKEKEPKRLEEAMRYLEKELETHYDSHSLWRAKAEFLKALGRDIDAQQSMERAEIIEGAEIPDIEHDIVVRMKPIETWKIKKVKIKYLGRATPRVASDLVED